jgi:hypothetical protein
VDKGKGRCGVVDNSVDLGHGSRVLDGGGLAADR